MFKIKILLLILILTACQNVIQPIKLNEGKWGGDQIMAEVLADKMTITWGCAVGEISEKIVLSNNKFSTTGTYLRRTGIPPSNLWTPPKPQAARYEGSINGKILTIKVFLIDENKEVGTYIVIYEQEEKIIYCS